MDDTLLEMQQALEANDFRVRAAVAAVAGHSIMRQFAAGRPDTEDTVELRRFVHGIGTALTNDPEGKTLTSPGSVPFQEYHGAPFRPTTTGACVFCGWNVDMYNSKDRKSFRKNTQEADGRRGAASRGRARGAARPDASASGDGTAKEKAGGKGKSPNRLLKVYQATNFDKAMWRRGKP